MCAVPWRQQTNNKSLKKWARAIRLRLRTYSFEFFDGGLLVGGGGSDVFAREGALHIPVSEPFEMTLVGQAIHFGQESAPRSHIHKARVRVE